MSETQSSFAGRRCTVIVGKAAISAHSGLSSELHTRLCIVWVECAGQNPNRENNEHLERERMPHQHHLFRLGVSLHCV